MIPYHVFACKKDWQELSPAVQQAIRATAHSTVLEPDRRAAIEAAREEWNGVTS
jgi:hypothetical protein